MSLRLTNTRESYGLIHQVLHWLTALLILTLLALGLFMDNLPVTGPEAVAYKVWWYSLHKTLGIAALAVIALRVLWAWIQPHPLPLKGGLEAFAAKVVHWLLYGAMILMPISGWLHHAAAEGFAPIWWPWSQDLPFVPKSPDLSRLFGIAHWVLAVTLGGAIGLHIAGAFKHLIIDRDKVLARMLPGAYRETGVLPENGSGQRAAFVTALTVLLIAGASVAGLFAAQSRSDDADRPTSAEAPKTKAKSAGAWVIDAKASSLAFEILQMKNPVTGRFADWQAEVVFDPKSLKDARINAQIKIGSLVLPDVSDQALSADFLNAAEHPGAVFKSDEIVATETGYEARGTLNVAGMEQPLVLPFTFREEGGRAYVTAKAVIERLKFGVGKNYPDDETVGRKVTVSITIEATR